MIYKHLYMDVIIRVMLLALSCFALAFAYFRINDIIINLNLLVLIIIQIVLFIRSSNRINRDLESFFISIKNEDSTLRFSQKFSTGSFRKLHQSLQEVNDLIQDIKLENVEQNQYFKTITDHISVGLIGFTCEGKVTLMNRSAAELLHLKGTITLSSLERIKKGLGKSLSAMKPAEQKLFKIRTSGINGPDLKQLAARATELKLRNETVKIVSLQDIKNELDEKEIEAWQNLIRVLTHEMMNSTGPIKSTTHTLIELLRSAKNKKSSNELMDDLCDGLKIIEERSIGLEMFVKHFRKFNLLPKPEFQNVKLDELFHHLEILLEEEIRSRKINFRYKIDKKTESIEADKHLLEQLFINLIKNAIHSLGETENPIIEISARSLNDGRMEISVVDNGAGIYPSEMEKIFIPFYTTHEKGSGIGLSLAKQIMRMHRGSIDAFSEPGIRTEFKLLF